MGEAVGLADASARSSVTVTDEVAPARRVPIRERVTVVVPVRDEERTVVAALDSLRRQTVGAERLEVLVYDGGSRDRTRELCASFAGAAPWARFEVIDNAARGVQHALNAGLAASRTPWLAVLSGRTTLSPDYLETCLDELHRAGPGSAVGGRFVAEAEGAVAKAIAAAVTHPLGVGKGFRTEARACELPHHPFAVWRVEDVRRFGGFDPELERNQDDEFSMRARRQGARIYLTPQAQLRYRPRERFRGLAVQYFQYGLWKAAVRARSGLFPTRAVVPPLAAATAFASFALALTGRSAKPMLATAGSYGAAGLLAGRRSRSNPLLTAAALATVHWSYGLGVILGSLRPRLTSSRVARTRVR